MGKMTELIRVARKYIGYDYQHFCNAFSGGCWAWCAAFVSVCAEESGNGAIIPWSTSCNEQIRQFKEAGVWLGKTQDIRVGDILYYDWDHIAEALPADHVGIVIEDNGDTVKVIEETRAMPVTLIQQSASVKFLRITAIYTVLHDLYMKLQQQ